MGAKFEKIIITQEFLDSHPNSFFVFGDNAQKVGTAGAAALRGHPRAISFVTKKAPNDNPSSFFKVEEYIKPFFSQLDQLVNHVRANPNHIFYISKLGSGLANYHYIWEKLIGHNLVEDLKEFDNVIFCWENEPDVAEIPLLEKGNTDYNQSSSMENTLEADKIAALVRELDEAKAIIKSQQDMYMREIARLKDELEYDGGGHSRYTRAAVECD